MFKPAQRRIATRTPRTFRPEIGRCEWSPYLDFSRPPRLHPFRDGICHYGYNRVRLIVDEDLLPKDSGVASVTFFPQSRINRSHIVPAFLVFILREKPPDHWTNTKHFEIVGRNQPDSHLLGLTTRIAKAHIFPPRIVSDNLLKSVVASREVPDIEWRWTPGIAGALNRNTVLSRVNADKQIGRVKGKWPEEKRIKRAKNRAVGANAQGKRGHRHQRESRIP